jgi:hypothetical protein
MTSIRKWQKDFSKAALKKFPANKKWNEQDRILSILRQLADVSGGIQKEKNIFPHPNKVYNDPNHRIAALIADILVLVDEREFNLEKELGEVLKWYKSKNAPLSK